MNEKPDRYHSMHDVHRMIGPCNNVQNEEYLGPVTRRKSRDETRSRRKVTRRDETRDGLVDLVSRKFFTKIFFKFWVFRPFFSFETEFFFRDGLARRSHETRRDRDGLVSSRLFSRRGRLVTGPRNIPSWKPEQKSWAIPSTQFAYLGRVKVEIREKGPPYWGHRHGIPFPLYNGIKKRSLLRWWGLLSSLKANETFLERSYVNRTCDIRR